MKKAQAATEFIIILSIALVLIASIVFIMSDTSIQRQDIDATSTQIERFSGPVSITQLIVSPIHIRIDIQNNQNSMITITDIQWQDTISNTPALPMRLIPGERSSIYLYDILLYPGQSFSSRLRITYEENGQEKVVHAPNGIHVSGTVQSLDNYEIQLHETIADDVALLLRFNNNPALGENAQTFVDSVLRRTYDCSATPARCPTIHQSGFTSSAFFDGDNVTLPFRFENAQNMTISVWVYNQVDPGWPNDVFIMGTSTGLSNKGINIELTDTDDIIIRRYDAGFSLETFTSTESVQKNTWTHILITDNQTHGAIFINGQPAGTTAYAITDITPTANDIVIGMPVHDPDGLTSYKGRLDEFTVWNRILTEQEIASLYRRGQIHLHTN